MRQRLRHALVTLAASVLVAGAASAAILPALPEAWRGPAVPWIILLAALVLVAAARRRRRPAR